MTNYFNDAFSGIELDQQVTNPNIQVGRYSYYSGHYQGQSFDDCARYLMTSGDIAGLCQRWQANNRP